MSKDNVEEDIKKLFTSGPSAVTADFGFQCLPSYRKNEPLLPDLEDGIAKKVDDYLERMLKDGHIKTDTFGVEELPRNNSEIGGRKITEGGEGDQLDDGRSETTTAADELKDFASFNGPSMFKSMKRERNILRPVRNQQAPKSRFAVSDKKESIHQCMTVKPEAPKIQFAVRASEEMENLITALNAEKNIDVENHREGSDTVSASTSTTFSEFLTKNTPRPVTPIFVDSAVSPGHLKPASRHEEPQIFCDQMTSLGHGAVGDANKEKNHFVGEEKREFVHVHMKLLTDLECALMELDLPRFRFASISVETKRDVEEFQELVKAIKAAPVVVARLFANEQMAPVIKSLYPGIYAEAKKFMEENPKT